MRKPPSPRRSAGGIAGLGFDQLLARVRRIPGMPAGAVAPLAAVIYRHLPLPRALGQRWDLAATHLARLREAIACTDDVRVGPFLDRFFRRFYPGAPLPERFGPGADRRPDRARLVALGFAILQRPGGASAAEATRLLVEVLARFAEGPRAGPASVARELLRARRRGIGPGMSVADARALEDILASPEDRRLPVPARAARGARR
jgi:hypothetical protein